LGGDEFLIVSDVTEIDAVNQFKLEIINEMRTYKSFEIIKELGVSIGSIVVEVENKLTVDKILDMVDKLMYIDKSNNKNLKRRKSDITK